MHAPVTVTAGADRGTQPRSGLLIGVLVVSAFVMILNETILSVGLRALTADLHVGTTTIPLGPAGLRIPSRAHENG